MNVRGGVTEEQMKKMKKRRGREKKKKDAGIEFTLLSGRRKIKRPPSDIAVAVNELIKKGYDTGDKIAGWFATERSRSLSNASKNMYLALVNSKVYADNVRLTDNITNHPLHCYYYIKSFKTKTLSNDELWLNLLTKKSYANIGGKTKELYDISEVYSAWFGSNVIEYTNKKILKGYYQDFSDTFAMIGANGLDEAKKLALLNGDKFNFELKQIKYTAAGNSNRCVIYKSDMDNDSIKALIKKTVEISSTENGFSLNEKKIELKKEVFKYVDCKVKPELFCPAFLIMPNEQEYSVLIKMNIDYNKLFLLMDKYTTDGDITVDDNLFYWDTINYFFDFLAIYIVTTKANNDNSKKELKEMYDTFIKYKPIIELWKTNQLKYQKILYNFYYAFAGKINYDKLDFLSKKLEEYISDRNRLMKEENYQNISNFFSGCALCTMIGNQFTNDVFSIADAMKTAIENLVTGGNDIVKELRKVGVLIYNVSMSSKGSAGSKTAFPFGVAFGTFLGNLWYQSGNVQGVLAANALNLQQRVAQNQEIRNKQAEDEFRLAERVEEEIKKKIEEFIRKEQDQLKFRMATEKVEEIKGIAFELMKTDNGYGKIKEEVYKTLKAKKPFTIDFSSNIKNKVDNFINMNKQDEINERIKAASVVNQKEQELNKAKEKYDSISSESNRKTTGQAGGLFQSNIQSNVNTSTQGGVGGATSQRTDGKGMYYGSQPVVYSEGDDIDLPYEEKKEEEGSLFGPNFPSINIVSDQSFLDPKLIQANNLSAAEVLDYYYKNNAINVEAPGSSYAQWYGDVLYLSGLYDDKIAPGDGAKYSFAQLQRNFGLDQDLINAVSRLYFLDYSNLPRYKTKSFNRADLVFDPETVQYVKNNSDATLAGTVIAKKDALRQRQQVQSNA